MNFLFKIIPSLFQTSFTDFISVFGCNFLPDVPFGWLQEEGGD